MLAHHFSLTWVSGAKTTIELVAEQTSAQGLQFENRQLFAMLRSAMEHGEIFEHDDIVIKGSALAMIARESAPQGDSGDFDGLTLWYAVFPGLTEAGDFITAPYYTQDEAQRVLDNTDTEGGEVRSVLSTTILREDEINFYVLFPDDDAAPFRFFTSYDLAVECRDRWESAILGEIGDGKYVALPDLRQTQ